VVVELLEAMVRSIGLDVHREFREVAIREDGDDALGRADRDVARAA
jgi:hypothetical protein